MRFVKKYGMWILSLALLSYGTKYISSVAGVLFLICGLLLFQPLNLKSILSEKGVKSWVYWSAAIALVFVGTIISPDIELNPEPDPFSPAEQRTMINPEVAERRQVDEKAERILKEINAESEEVVEAKEKAAIEAELPLETKEDSLISEENPEKQALISTTEPIEEPEKDNTIIASENAENFNKYNNSEQQKTPNLVLNTKTKVIHNPWCNSVKKIAPENYETTTQTIEDLERQGYKRCGQKGDW